MVWMSTVLQLKPSCFHGVTTFLMKMSSLPPINLPSHQKKCINSQMFNKKFITVVKKYSQFAVVNLYVAGYTDTVGDSGHNLQLSTERAKSIGTWFKQNGFEGSIYYQGFGESVLAVPTADGVDEAANRRVLYVVAATAPKSQGVLSQTQSGKHFDNISCVGSIQSAELSGNRPCSTASNSVSSFSAP